MSSGWVKVLLPVESRVARRVVKMTCGRGRGPIKATNLSSISYLSGQMCFNKNIRFSTPPSAFMGFTDLRLLLSHL